LGTLGFGCETTLSVVTCAQRRRAALSGKRFLSVREAAALAGVSEQYVRKVLRSGALRGIRIGKAWAVDEKKLQHWLEERALSHQKRPKAGKPPRGNQRLGQVGE